MLPIQLDTAISAIPVIYKHSCLHVLRRIQHTLLHKYVSGTDSDRCSIVILFMLCKFILNALADCPNTCARSLTLKHVQVI